MHIPIAYERVEDKADMIYYSISSIYKYIASYIEEPCQRRIYINFPTCYDLCFC